MAMYTCRPKMEVLEGLVTLVKAFAGLSFEY